MGKFTRRDFLGRSIVGAGAVGLAAGGCDPDAGGALLPEGEVYVPATTVPVLAECEVLVLGGGPAGLSAAIAAAREGADTVLVERYGSFGGVITQQTMGSIAWYRFADTVDAGGIRGEMESRAKEMGASLDVFGDVGPEVVGEELTQVFFHYLEEAGLRVDGKPTYEILETEIFKHVADTMLLDAGVRPVLHCWAVDAIMDGTTIRGVITESKSGRQAILAQRVIDCTGDADVAHFAGAGLTKAAPEDLMECTQNFGVSGVDLKELLLHMLSQQGGLGDWSETGDDTAGMLTPTLIEPYLRAKQAGEIPEEADVQFMTYMGCYTTLGEIPDMNSVHLTGVDGTNVWDLTNAEMKSRERILWAIQALKKYTPGFENARLRTFAPNIGIRETRKIVGAYELSVAEARGEARFDDSIGICPEFLDGFGLMILPTTGRYFQVPYGITVPEGVENLLVAGRAVSSDRLAFTATRQMVCCTLTGQAAGVASAVSLQSGVTSREVDISLVQERLRAQDVRIA